MELTKEQNDALSRVRNAAKDTGDAYKRMEKGIDRLQGAMKQCREDGLSDWQIENMLLDASNGNPEIIEFLEKLAKV